MLLDPSGKTSITSITYNKNASKVAIGTQSKGAEITDIRIIDTKTGKQIGKHYMVLDLFLGQKMNQKLLLPQEQKN